MGATDDTQGEKYYEVHLLLFLKKKYFELLLIQ